jgi:hypothetical protein
MHKAIMSRGHQLAQILQSHTKRLHHSLSMSFGRHSGGRERTVVAEEEEEEEEEGGRASGLNLHHRKLSRKLHRAAVTPIAAAATTTG